MATRSSLWPPGTRDRLGEPEVYDLLHNDRRRRTVRFLCEHAGEVSLEDLATMVARAESEDGTVTPEAERSVYNALHQTHLPRLEAADVVVYDRNGKVVSLTATAGDLEQYLGLRSPYGFTWGEYYRTVATGSLLVVLAVELDLWLFAGADVLPFVTLALGLLAVSMLYQLWRRRWIYVRSVLG